ncbi:hypothetical protein FB566_1080 [Stackebrandtia endophytica]|uniref:Uncharacterized protein n=1 Tax=Stackebrandtia endophytica TaxID=1496996 RepID=A0A543ASL1_9ACTN|nr:hypothetical protein [Stackebrandtia endophytica]TQL75573.1 hypothetical protein FB566_1080 [Stackebrandtia endophytica]
MRRPALAVVIALFGITLTACGTGPDPAAESSSPAVTGQAATGDAEAGTTEAAPREKVALAFENDYKSVFTVDRAGIDALTGLTLDDDNLAEVAQALRDEAVWADDDLTADYAGLIADAAGRESGSVTDALLAVLRDPSARMRVYIAHTPNVTIAHIGIDHGD